MNPLYDVNQAARVLAVSPWTIRAYIRQGKLQPVRIGRLVRLEPQEIQNFIEGAKVKADLCAVVGEGGAR
jgi:excisionase family DNA binding protein